MKIKVNMYSGKQASVGANIALGNRLYISGWYLSTELKRIRSSPREEDKIAILTEDDIPVAVASETRYNVQCFVRKSKRLNGYGKMVVKSLGDFDVLKTGCGVDGSNLFWDKCL